MVNEKLFGRLHEALGGVGVDVVGQSGKFGNTEQMMKYASIQTTIQTTIPTRATGIRVLPLRVISSKSLRRFPPPGRLKKTLSMLSGILPIQAQIVRVGPNKTKRITKIANRDSRLLLDSRMFFIVVTCTVHD